MEELYNEDLNSLPLQAIIEPFKSNFHKPLLSELKGSELWAMINTIPAVTQCPNCDSMWHWVKNKIWNIQNYSNLPESEPSSTECKLWPNVPNKEIFFLNMEVRKISFLFGTGKADDGISELYPNIPDCYMKRSILKSER